jgi:translation initiation factor IF-3
VPVPRRFDRRPPERDTTRINERIRVPEVRVIGEDGNQIGVMRTDEALRYAQQRDLDLVEVAPEARPPVTRVLDYSKYKYEQAQKQKAARKHQQQITIREIKFRPKIAVGDYATKKGHVERFLKRRDKVKVTIMFRGREVTHPERGQMILDRLAEELADLAIVEQRPNLDGRNMTMMLGPSKAVLAGQYDKDGGQHEGEDADAEGTQPAAGDEQAATPDREAAPPEAVTTESEPAPDEAAAEATEPAADEATANEPAADGAAASEPAAAEAAATASEPAADEAAGDGRTAAPEPAPEPAAEVTDADAAESEAEGASADAPVPARSRR